MSSSWLVLPACYLLGSLSPSREFVRIARHVDLRETNAGYPAGAGHLGASAAIRYGGARVGFCAAVADLAKGALAAGLARWAFGPGPLAWLGVVAVILGHNFPIFYGFRGGKGAAATYGAAFALAPLAALSTMVCAGLTKRLTGNDLNHVAALTLFVALPATVSLLLPNPSGRVAMQTALLLLALVAVVIASIWRNWPMTWQRAGVAPLRWHVWRVAVLGVACATDLALLIWSLGPATALLAAAAAGQWLVLALLLITLTALGSRAWRLATAFGAVTVVVYGLSLVASLAGGSAGALLLFPACAGRWPASLSTVSAWQVLVLHDLLHLFAVVLAGLVTWALSRRMAQPSAGGSGDA